MAIQEENQRHANKIIKLNHTHNELIKEISILLSKHRDELNQHKFPYIIKKHIEEHYEICNQNRANDFALQFLPNETICSFICTTSPDFINAALDLVAIKENNTKIIPVNDTLMNFGINKTNAHDEYYLDICNTEIKLNM